MDNKKDYAIVEWPEHKILHDIHSFQGLTTLYKRFIKDLSTIVVPIIDCLRKKTFTWTLAASKSFQEIKDKIIHAPMLRLSNFFKSFKVACDAFGIGIRGRVLNQEGHSIVYFSKKLKVTLYTKFYAAIQTLRHWRRYLLPQEFALHSDHDALQFLNLEKS